ncbi:hypothetical protein, partial [Marivirga sericea]|uniref:hypothetical protein n=1 Tax=Marivirga sericea TaxID=1028 RepID=UPI001C87A210
CSFLKSYYIICHVSWRHDLMVYRRNYVSVVMAVESLIHSSIKMIAFSLASEFLDFLARIG